MVNRPCLKTRKNKKIKVILSKREFEKLKLKKFGETEIDEAEQ